MVGTTSSSFSSCVLERPLLLSRRSLARDVLLLDPAHPH